MVNIKNYMNEKPDGIIEQINLEQIELNISQSIDLDCFLTVKHSQMISDRFIFKMKSFLYGEDLPDKIITYPSNWWEAIKHRWYPNWLKRIFPVVYEKVTCSFTAFYPDYKPKLPHESVKKNFTTYRRTTTHE